MLMGYISICVIGCSLIMSVLVCITRLTMNRYCVYIVVFWTITLFIAYMCAGAIVKLPAEQKEFIKINCERLNEGNNDDVHILFDTLFGDVAEIDEEWNIILNDYMCTDVCPCYKGSESYEKYNKDMDEI